MPGVRTSVLVPPNPSTPTRSTSPSGGGPSSAIRASSSTWASTRRARATNRSPAAVSATRLLGERDHVPQ